MIHFISKKKNDNNNHLKRGAPEEGKVGRVS